MFGSQREISSVFETGKCLFTPEKIQKNMKTAVSRWTHGKKSMKIFSGYLLLKRMLIKDERMNHSPSTYLLVWKR
ncbi:hypothetical protein YC2023_087354 [Brassica napus]